MSVIIQGHTKKTENKASSQEADSDDEAGSNDEAAVGEPAESGAAFGATAEKVDEAREYSTQVYCRPSMGNGRGIVAKEFYKAAACKAVKQGSNNQKAEARLDDRTAVEDPAVLRAVDTNEGSDQRVQVCVSH